MNNWKKVVMIIVYEVNKSFNHCVSKKKKKINPRPSSDWWANRTIIDIKSQILESTRSDIIAACLQLLQLIDWLISALICPFSWLNTSRWYLSNLWRYVTSSNIELHDWRVCNTNQSRREIGVKAKNKYSSWWPRNYPNLNLF